MASRARVTAWGFTPTSRKRHLFVMPHGHHGVSDAQARRSLQPRAACGTAYAPIWPPANPPNWSALACVTCARLEKQEADVDG